MYFYTCTLSSVIIEHRNTSMIIQPKQYIIIEMLIILRTGTRTETRAETKAETRTKTRTETKSEIRTETRSETKAVTETGTRLYKGA